MKDFNLSDIYKELGFDHPVPLSIMEESEIENLKDLSGARVLDKKAFGQFKVGMYLSIEDPVGRYYIFLPRLSKIFIDVCPEDLYISPNFPIFILGKLNCKGGK